MGQVGSWRFDHCPCMQACAQACVVPSVFPSVAAQRQLLPWLVSICHSLSIEQAWAAHVAHIARQPLAQDIVQLCLSFAGVLAVALPLPPEQRPAGYEWIEAFQLGELFAVDCPLHPALRRHLQAADGSRATAALTAVAQLVQNLPLDQPPAGFSQEQYRGLLATVTNLLTTLCIELSNPRALGQLGVEQRRQVAKQLLPLAGLPHQLQCAHGSRQGEQCPAEDDQLLLVGVDTASCLMQLLVALRQADCDAFLRAGGQRPATLLASSSADVAAWCSASGAAVQCMPSVQRLHSPDRQREAPLNFVDSALDLAWCAAFYVETEAMQPARHAAAVQLAAWQLHSWLAQLVHFMAAAEQPLVRLGDEQHAAALLTLLASAMVDACHLASTPAEEMEESGAASAGLRPK